MEVGAFYLPSLGRKEDILQGMAGKRTDLYKQMLKELSEQFRRTPCCSTCTSVCRLRT